MTTKVCSKCKVEKDVGEFGKDKRRALGITLYCLCCTRSIARNFYESNENWINTVDRIDTVHIGRICAPYCVKEMSDGRLVILNRLYKPIGTYTFKSVDYASQAVRLRLTDEMVAKVSIDGKGWGTAVNHSEWDSEERSRAFYIYDDSCDPYMRSSSASQRKDGLARVARFFKLLCKVKP